MRKTPITLLFIFLIFDLYAQKDNRFDTANIDSRFNTHILGYIENARDSTRVTLLDFYNQTAFPDAYIVNNSFKFNINIFEPRSLQLTILDNEKLGYFNGRHIIFNQGVTKLYAKDEYEFNKLEILSGSAETMEFEEYFQSNEYKFDVKYTQEHPDTFLGLYILWLNRNNLSNSELEKYFSNLGLMWMHTSYYKDINSILESRYEPIVGNLFFGFSLRDENDKLIDLNQLRGKYVLIEFTASWCKPCAAEIPYQKKAYEKFKNSLEILHIYIENKGPMIASKEKHEIPWLTVYEPLKIMSEIAQKSKVSSLPTFFLLDPDGRIIANKENAVFRGDTLEIVLNRFIKD